MLLDHFVRGLPAHPGPHRGDQYRGAGQERQVAVQLAGDHRGIGAELVEHGEGGLEQPVQGEEGVRQGDPADHRVGHVPLVPLRPGQLPGHAGVAAQQHQHPVDPLGAARVHLVRHGRRADLAGLETLGGQLGPGHQPDRGGQRGRRGGQLDQRGEHVEVQRAGVHLPDAGQRGGEAEVLGHRGLQRGQPVGVAVEQVEHVLRGAHRALDPAQRVPGLQLLQPRVGDQHLVGRRREPLAQGGGLGGDVVAAPGQHQFGVLGGAPGQPGQHRDRAVPDVLAATAGSAAARRSR